MVEISSVLSLVLLVQLVVEVVLVENLALAGEKEILYVLFLELMVELVAAPVESLT